MKNGGGGGVERVSGPPQPRCYYAPALKYLTIFLPKLELQS